MGRIVAYLEARGVECWIAGRDIPPRAIYAEAITAGIQDSGACAVIVSTAANASAAIKRELELASHYGKSFVPIRVDETEPGPGLDYYLRNTQWVNYARDGNSALDRIVTHMAQGAPPVMTRSHSPPPAPKKNAVGTVAMIAIGALLLLGGGWAVWSNLHTFGAAPTDAVEFAPAEPAVIPETSRAVTASENDTGPDERERLERERDEALAAARTAEAKLAEREELARAANNVVGVWHGQYSYSGDGGSGALDVDFRGDGRFAVGGADVTIGSWIQDGPNVTWTYDNGGTIYRGRISGRSLTGQMTHPGYEGTFSLAR